MKTQKAEGLRNCYVSFMDKVQFHVYRDGETEPVPFGGMLFVRPCPVRPRHGFLESFKVHSDNLSEALHEVWQQMRDIEEDGEILVCPFIDAQLNAIITSGKITLGPGNDGATSGRNALTLPFPNVYVHNWNHEWGEPYIEAVFSENKWVATQFRGGPKVENSNDYIVDGYKVEHIFELRNEIPLLEWERMVKTFPRGTVVFHRGGAVTSHYGVHCVTAGIPYFTTRIPKIGEVLRAESRKPKRIVKSFREILETLKINPMNMGRVARAALYVLHNVPRFTPEQAELLVPLFAAAWVRLGEALCFGEARHDKVRHVGDCAVSEFSEMGLSRDYVYGEACLSRVPIMIEDAHKCFARCHWSENYGGKAWARCAKSIIAIKKARSFSELIRAWNRSVHLAHNTGWWFNKILSKDDFDRIDEPRVALKAVTTIYEILTPRTPEDFIVNLEEFLQWRPLDEKKMRIQHPETDLEVDAFIQAPEGYQYDFRLPSTAGTDRKYAPCKLVVRNGEPLLRLYVADGGFVDINLRPVVLPKGLGRADAIRACLLGISMEKHEPMSW